MAKKSDRPTFGVPDDILPSFKRYVVAKQIFEIAQSRMEAENGAIKAKMIDSFTDSLVRIKRRPANPRLTLADAGKPDIEGLFQVQEKFSPQAVEGDGPVAERLKTAFVSAGVSADTADKIVANEVVCEDKTTLKPFSEMINGAPIEQELAGRLMKLLLDSFTDDERKLMIQPASKIEVKEGFFERLGIYVKDKAEAIGAIRVMKPVHFMSHMKLGLSDTPQGRLNRLYEYSKEMITGEVPPSKG
jgi:hypothetical protein